MSERKLKIANYTLNITVDRNYLGVLSLSLRFQHTFASLHQIYLRKWSMKTYLITTIFHKGDWRTENQNDFHKMKQYGL